MPQLLPRIEGRLLAWYGQPSGRTYGWLTVTQDQSTQKGRAAAVALVNDADRGQQSGSSWVSDPAKALLRRQMGIAADVDARIQEKQSRIFRRVVRNLAGIDFTKTWTQLERDGETEDMISSISPPSFSTLAILIRWLKRW